MRKTVTTMLSPNFQKLLFIAFVLLALTLSTSSNNLVAGPMPPTSHITESLIYTKSLSMSSLNGSGITLSTNGGVNDDNPLSEGGGLKQGASFNGSSSVQFDVANLQWSTPGVPNPTQNLHIQVQFKDNGHDYKTALIEVTGHDSNGQDIRFYVGVNFDGQLNDPEDPNRHHYCIGNSVGDINSPSINKVRRCLNNIGINRLPLENQWVTLDIFVTEVGTYALVNGIPTAPFGRNDPENDRSNNKQVNGFFTPLTSVEKIVISNKAMFKVLPNNEQCAGAGTECSTAAWRNLKIFKLTLAGNQQDWLYDTALRYTATHPSAMAIPGGTEAGLKYRWIAEELMLKAFMYRKSGGSSYLNDVKATINTPTLSASIYAQGLESDVNSGDVLKKLRVGQSVYSFGMTYSLVESALTLAERQKLLSIVETGLQILIEDVTFVGGTRPCAVSQESLSSTDSRIEEDMWKVGGLSVGLALPLSSNFPYSKQQIEDIMWTCLEEAFSRNDDPNRPQYPGWNVKVLNSTTTESVIANHGFMNNPDYAVCSTMGNLLRANVAIEVARDNGYQTTPGRDYMRPYSVRRLWISSEKEFGLDNRFGHKYMNPRDYLFFPFTKLSGETAFSRKLPEGIGADIWKKGYDDWGTTGRWCTSGILLAQVDMQAIGVQTFQDFEQLVKINQYLERHGLTFPVNCYRGNDITKPGYSCHYTQATADSSDGITPSIRHRGLDLSRAHRDMISYLFLYGLP